MNINLLDCLALIILLLSVTSALVKGFFAELFSLISVCGGLVLAVLFYARAAEIAEILGLTGLLAEFAGFLGIFVFVVLAGAIVNGLVKRILSALRLRWIDRILGGVFGLVRGWVINLALFVALATFQIGGDLLAQSRLSEFFLTSASLLVMAAPPDFRIRFEQEYRKIYRIWLERTQQNDTSITNSDDT